jgi:hypothetical protein
MANIFVGDIGGLAFYATALSANEMVTLCGPEN